MIRPLRLLAVLLALAPAAAMAAPLPAPTLSAIRAAHYPALSPDGRQLCFEYLGDLWVVPSEGGMARRLTVHPAYDAWPRWSPDGRWIAFSSNRQGNFDVYIIPARGGEARQLTFDSSDDFVCDWSPDGEHILFSSPRGGRYQNLYTLSVKDGRLRQITRDRTQSRYGAYAPDGKTILYARGAQPWWRPRYRGSQNADIWSIPAEGGKAVRVTTTSSWNSWPYFDRDGTTRYFVSMRDGASNLYRLRESGAEPQKLTRHVGDAVLFPSISRDGDLIAYEQGFHIWTLRLRENGRPVTLESPRQVAIFAPADLQENLRQNVTFGNGVKSLSVSPDGKTLAFAARGELWTCPTDGGDATRLTRGGAAEFSPAWSPDGKFLTYLSDRSGSLNVCLMDVKTKKETPVTSDTTDDSMPQFSPAGRFLAWVREGGKEPGLCVIPIGPNGEVKPADAVLLGAGAGIDSFDWSPDGRWLVYARRDPTSTTDLWIVPGVGGTPINVTGYPGYNGQPHWSRDGKYIVFVSTRASSPDSPVFNVYRLPLMPPPDEPEKPGPPPSGAAPLAKAVPIEFDGIRDRAVPVTTTREIIQQGALAPDARTAIININTGRQSGWWAVDILTGSMNPLAPGEPGESLDFAPDGSRFYYTGADGTIYQVTKGSSAPARVTFSASMDMDRRALAAEAFNEAWRTLRTHFYDPTMHGVDWTGLRAKYEPLVAQSVEPLDFVWVLDAMIGELNASHLGAAPAPEPGPKTATGYLGLTFDQDYAGPGLKVKQVLAKGPADRTGHRVEVGEYVLSLDGQEVTYGAGLFQALADKAGKNVELLVNAKPDRQDARTVTVKAITSDAVDNLEYDQWVAKRRQMVDDLSGGKLAYIHIRAMDPTSLARFQRELFGDTQNKQGLVLDVRFNPGGRIHDQLLSLLMRKPHAYETPRDAERSPQPFQLWDRPIVLLTNEYSASDAEVFANGFRTYGLGRIVGMPTAGAVIGTYDITLLDGTRFRIPTTGWTDTAGKPLEGRGVQPDVGVDNSPDDNATGNDRQLEAAVRDLLPRLPAK